jgi:hypothetical protein
VGCFAYSCPHSHAHGHSVVSRALLWVCVQGATHLSSASHLCFSQNHCSLQTALSPPIGFSTPNDAGMSG